MWLLRRFPPQCQVSSVRFWSLVLGATTQLLPASHRHRPNQVHPNLMTVNHRPEINTQSVQCVRLNTTPAQQTASHHHSSPLLWSVATCCAHQSLLCCIISVIASRSFTYCQSEHRRGSLTKQARPQGSGLQEALTNRYTVTSTFRHVGCAATLSCCCCWFALASAAVKALRTSDYWWEKLVSVNCGATTAVGRQWFVRTV